MSGNEPEVNPSFERKVREGLERSYAYAKAQKNEVTASGGKARFVIFSDHHRGVRDGADDFFRCEKAYSAALGHYFESGYTLIILGDAEELWECRPAPVVASYRETLLLEAAFQKENRYIRIYGNHDDYWEQPSGVRSLLDPIFGPSLRIVESMRLLFDQGEGTAREIFLIHGHQGDFLSGPKRKISKFFVRCFWRPFQRLTKIKLTTPAKDVTMRDELSSAMYRWAAQKKGLVLIAGHTHLPVFEVRERFDGLEKELEEARASGNTALAAQLRAQLELLRARVRERSKTNGLMEKPSYFNAGCCSFSDGDVTGIEICDGWVKLVRWPDDAGNPRPKILQEAKLQEVFDAVSA